MSASPPSLSQSAAGSGAETSRQGGEHGQRTVRKRHWQMLLCLSCLSAVVLVLLVLAVVYALLYALVPESLAQHSLMAARRCGDIPTWGESHLKDHYQLCTQNMCSLATCGPINDSVCHMKPLVFEDKCKCCDWCLLRTVNDRRIYADMNRSIIIAMFKFP
ncbi:uncharacterized protein [Dermacentor albipictus]|uniref:uncharacterized protein n=1 Tax=Dermacentor albipictus TaxID=60249 RepID=UPI0031FD44C0